MKYIINTLPSKTVIDIATIRSDGNCINPSADGWLRIPERILIDGEVAARPDRHDVDSRSDGVYIAYTAADGLTYMISKSAIMSAEVVDR